MRLQHVLLFLLVAICCAETVAGPRSLWSRQDGDDAANPDDPDAGNKDPPPANGNDPQNGSDKNNKDGSSTTTKKAASKTKGGITTSTNGKTNAKSDASGLNEGENLPIHPSLTPAVGTIGVVLIVTGVAYALIGIKHEWLLVFLSTAYLTSLGVTVLIVYVMDPPVSDAIQGAYFVAAFMTGMIFGSLSLIFREATRGFGCLLGGFCLAMWLLCLKPGGLITSTVGRAIMIGACSAVAWSLAFSQYTRNYGTLGCTAFAGAMISIIGVDCFTRAGLKEFWIYIWGKFDGTRRAGRWWLTICRS